MRTILSAAIAAFATLACSSSDSSSSTSGASSSSVVVSTVDCAPRCEAKAARCQVPQPKETCGGVCGTPTTEGQLSCYEGQNCSEVSLYANIDLLCPKPGGSPGATGTATFGQSCTCVGASAQSSGFCSGADTPCAATLSCIYETGSSGVGKCYSIKCCTNTAACDADASLLKPCVAGSCKRTAVGFYCGM